MKTANLHCDPIDPSALSFIERVVMESPLLGPVLQRWDEIALPDGWLVAGSIAQTIWNKAHDLPSTYGIKDIDITYFEGADLSEQAEAAEAARIRKVFVHSPVHIDVKNEARVHLWYAHKYGYSIPPYTSTRHAITTFPTTSAALGIRPTPSGLELYAPFGVGDLLGLIVRPNKVQITPMIYAAKVQRWRALWPRLRVIDWDATEEPFSTASPLAVR